MSDFQLPTNETEFHKNFAQIKPLMNATMAYYESARCLFCYDAPCVKACPTEIDIPLFIRQISTGDTQGSAKTIYASNYFGNICGKVCPTEVLCEGACVYNHQGVKPIEIGRLQSFATTHVIEKDLDVVEIDQSSEMKVAIVGAGPAGIACACELRLHGIQVDIFEAKSLPSGLALYGTAPYKVTNEEVLKEVEWLQSQFGFSIHYNRPISDRASIAELEDQYDAIFLGIGLGQTRSVGMEGEELPQCIGAAELIEQLKIDPLSVNMGSRVVVIGGGNTAMDAASESARMGSEATLLYRRSKGEMGAYDFEYDLAKSVGAKAIFNTDVKKIVEENGHLVVHCEKNNSHKSAEKIDTDTSFEIECDMVIKATGQLKQTELLDLFNLQYDQGGRIVVDGHTYQCSQKKYFAGGDAVNGGAEVVNACAEGKKAAMGIIEYLAS